jgi:alkanesulfonate monooxygenase SsuD/methylene tetrahydromethanopterin reductase-like flavin-dependent oxidoreductase (luciferase family)
VKFSLLYELQRAPGGPDYYYKVVHEALEQIVLADSLGFDTVWFVEHHFLENFSASPWPEGMLSAISQRTRRIRMGLGVVILPYHHPVRVAERIALLDILSDGRVEFGTGRSGPYEQVGMGIDPRETRGMWEESLRIITQIWASEGEYSYQGNYWQIPPRVILPRPIQQPHPPIWLSGMQAETYQLAADRGLGVLAFTANTPDTLRPHIADYRTRVRQAQPAGAFVNNQWASFTLAHCNADNDAARQLCATAVREFFGPGRPYAAAAAGLVKDLLERWGGDVPGHLRRYILPAQNGQPSSDVLRGVSDTAIRSIWNELDPDSLCDSGAIIAGDPQSCIRGVEKHIAAGADQVILNMQNATIPHERVLESIELFGTHVIPHFRLDAATAPPPKLSGAYGTSA